MATHASAFTLYVAGHGARSVTAESNLRILCECYLHGGYAIQVLDILERPDVAGRQRVMATPTLIRRWPPPELRIIGDLSDLPAAAALLSLPDTTSSTSVHAAPATAGGVAHNDRGIF